MKEKCYSIAIRERNNDNYWEDEDYIFKKIDLNEKRYWYADPFLFEFKDITYIFYEAFDLIKNKGVIGYSKIRRDGTVTPIKVIIEEPYHLSFPYIFADNDCIYIMPESCTAKQLRVYKAIEFPDKWKLYNVINKDIYTCDTIIVEGGKDKFLLSCSMFENKPNIIPSCYVKNLLFAITDDLRKISKEALIAAEGDYGVRNAGKVFEYSGKYYRPGQDCTNKQYGKGIVIFELQSLKPYIEKPFLVLSKDELSKHMTPQNTNPLLGTHTYNISSKYEVVDFSEMRDLPRSISYKRLAFKIIRKIKKIMRKVL